MVTFTQFTFEGARPDSDDIDEGITNLYFTDFERGKLGSLDPNAQVPSGGLPDQVLTKDGPSDHDMEWRDLPAVDTGLMSFNGRTDPNVVPMSGDYSADIVNFDPSGSSLTSLDVEGALNELAFRTDQSTINGHIIQNGGTDLAQEDRLNFSDSFIVATAAAGATEITFNPSGLMEVITYDPTGVGGDAFDLGNHHGSLTLSQISDSGDLAALDTVSTSDIELEAVTDGQLNTTGVVATLYQWPSFQVSTKGRILSATENSSPLERANHTGTQLISTISDAAAIAASGNADDLADGVARVAMTSAERVALAALDPNAQVPPGGVLGQVLTKNSAANFDASWQPAGGGGSGHVIKDQTTTFPQRTNLTFLGFSVVDDAGGDSTNVVAPTGQPLDFYGAFGIEDANLPETVNLLPAQVWVEFVPSVAPTYDTTMTNVSAGSNNGRLAVDFGMAIPETNAVLVASMTLELTSTNQTVEVGLMENGSIVADNILTQSVSTQTVVLGGVGIPLTFYVPLSDGVFEGSEYSVAFRRTTGTGNVNVTSFYMTLDGGEASGQLGTGDMLKSVYDKNDNAIVDKADSICREAVNRSGATLLRGTLVTYVQWDIPADLPEIALADKDIAGAEAVGMVTDDILDGQTGTVMLDGWMDQINTLGTAALQVVYLGNGGAITFTEPVTGLVQPVGSVVKENAAQGVITIENPLEAVELAEVFLRSRDAQMAGQLSTNGFDINLRDVEGGPIRGYLRGLAASVRLHGNQPLFISADANVEIESNTGLTRIQGVDVSIQSNSGELLLNTTSDKEVRVGDNLRVDPTAGTVIHNPGPTFQSEFQARRGDDVNNIDAKFTVLNAAGAQQLALGSFGTTGSRELRFFGDSLIENQADNQNITVNNIVFRRQAGNDVMRMPLVDGNPNDVIHTDGVGNYFLAPVTVPPQPPADPRIGNFSSTGSSLTINLANIEVAYVQVNHSPLTIDFSNGPDGKAFRVAFTDNVGPMILVGGLTLKFGTDIADFPAHGAAGEVHWYSVICYQPNDDYQIVAYARGF